MLPQACEVLFAFPNETSIVVSHVICRGLDFPPGLLTSPWIQDELGECTRAKIHAKFTAKIMYGDLPIC